MKGQGLGSGSRMISVDEVLTKAGHLKLAMVSRAKRIEQLAADIGKAHAGMVKVHPERLQTMEMEFGNLASAQDRDGKYYATLRWVLECTEDIDPDNLQIDL